MRVPKLFNPNINRLKGFFFNPFCSRTRESILIIFLFAKDMTYNRSVYTKENVYKIQPLQSG